ncbi:hypothetical protein M3J09_001110 [Ascochyta lentis]
MIALIALLSTCSYTQKVADVPIVVAPSGKWSGPDGPWSTFNLGVGNPFQAFEGVPGTSSSLALLPTAAESCDEAVCPGRNVFYSENSSSWKTAGVYSLPVPYYYTENLFKGINGTRGAVWGQDVMYLGNSERDIPSEIYIAEIRSADFVVASFGLAAGKVGGSTITHPTLLTSLRQKGDIPSASFSYTAGSARRNSSGSLVLGGYDASRFDSSTTVSLQMPALHNNSLVVVVDSITLSGTLQGTWKPEGTTGASFNVDSTLPQLWLPLEACIVFEKTFGIVWNDTAQLYLLDDIVHNQLQQSSPVVNITIPESDQRIVTFALPYTAFDLTATVPLVSEGSSATFV